MSASLPPWLEPLGDGVHAIDTGFHRDRYDAAYLVVEGGRAAFIDTGTAFAVPRLLGALDALGLAPGAVDLVIPTHVHLDHAGGVGQLMQALPAARLLVHPRGARHLVNPLALYLGALKVYGQAVMDRDYGRLLPVPEERVDTSKDGQVVTLAGRPLLLAHTPGHALHHHCAWDARSGGWFTGDNFGMAISELRIGDRPFIFPTTTPVQFDPDAISRASCSTACSTTRVWPTSIPASCCARSSRPGRCRCSRARRGRHAYSSISCGVPLQRSQPMRRRPPARSGVSASVDKY